MGRRKVHIILGAAILAAGLSGCKESASKKYSSAQTLINNGQYSEAVKKLREITSYEDAAQLLLYASANAAAVEGSFSEAITTLQSLGDYKDSQNLGIWRGNPRPFNDRDESAACFIEALGLFQA